MLQNSKDLVREQFFGFLNKYLKVLLIFIFVAVFGAAFYFTATFISEKRVQTDTDLFKEAYNLRKEFTKEDKQQEIQKQLDSILSKVSSSKVKTLVFIIQADFLLAQEKKSEALELLNSVYKNISDAVIKDLMVIKKCQLELELVDESLVENVIKEIEELSISGHATVKNFANYTLHKYFFNKHDFEKALSFGRSYVNQAEREHSANDYDTLYQEVSSNINLIS